MAAPLNLGITIRVNGGNSNAVLGETEQRVRGVGNAAASTNREFAAMAQSFKNMALGFAGGAAFTALAKDILDTNRSMETLRMQLTALTGSAEGAKDAFHFIQSFATNTPYEIGGLTKSFVTLQNMGIRPTQQVMQALTDQASKLGGSQETLDSIVLQLGQAYSKGKLQMEDMNILAGRGVPVYDLLAQVTGKNTAELVKMSDAGTIGRDIIEQLIVKMGEMASGSNALAMDTLNGKISNLADAWHHFEDVLLNDQAEGLIKNITDSITKELNILTNVMDSSVSAQITKTQNRIDNFNGMGAAGRFFGDIMGYDVNVEKNRLDTLNKQKKRQDELAAERDYQQNLKGIYKQTSDWLDEMATADAEKAAEAHKKIAKSSADTTKKAADDAKKKADAISKGIADEMAALNDQHLKLTLSERDYFAASLAAKHFDESARLAALAVWDSNKAIEAQQAVDAKAKASMDGLIDRYQQLTLSARDYFIQKLKNDGLKPEQVAAQTTQFDKNAGIESQQQQINATRQALESYNSTLDAAKNNLQDFGNVASSVLDGSLGGINTLVGAFGNMGKAIADNAAALAILKQKQKENAEWAGADQAKDFDQWQKDQKLKADNAKRYAEEEAALNRQSTLYQLDGVRQIAGAAAQMFGEKTAAAKAFHGIEVALSVAGMAMKAREMAVSLAATGTKLAEGAATLFAEGGFAGFAGVAAMMAVMAGLGFAGGGGTAGAPPKPSPDTGSVLGDSTAQSQSSDKIYNLLKDIHASEYAQLRGINSGVAGLQVNFGTTVAAIFKGGGLANPNLNLSYGLGDFLSHKLGTTQGLLSTALSTGIGTAIGFGASALATSLGSAAVFGGAGGGLLAGSGIGAVAGPIGIVAGLLFSLVSALFSGGYRHVDEQGIRTDSRSVGDIMANQGVKSSQYNMIKTRGWDLFSDWTRYDTVFTELDAKVQKSLSAVFVSIGNSSLELAKALGGDLETKLKAYVLPELTINLTNLNAEDANKKMQAVINTAWDNMIKTVFGPVIGDFQQVGEGMAETASRLVAEMAVVKDALATANQTMPKDAIAVSDALVQMAGGLKQFQSAFGDYYDKFYTDAQKQAKLHSQLAAALSEVGLRLPSTRDGYQQLVSALDVNNAADRTRYLLLLQLATAADSYYNKLENIKKSYQEQYYSEAENLSANLRDLSLAFNQLDMALPVSRDGFRQLADGIDTSTEAGKALFAQMLGLSDSFYTLNTALVSAYQKAADLLKAQIDSHRQQAGELRAFSDSLLSGALSGATPLQKYVQAQAAFTAVQTQLASGTKAEKEAATGKLQAVAQGFLEASRGYNASSTAYLNDFAAVQATLADAIDSNTTAANMAQAQLDQLAAQAKGIGLVKDAVDATTAAVNTVKAALDTLAGVAASSGYERYAPTFEAAKLAASKAPMVVAMGSDPDIVNLMAGQLQAEAKKIYGDKATGLADADWKARLAVVQAFFADAASYQQGFLDPNMTAKPFSYYEDQAKAIDGSHADGLAYVPFDGYVAQLHKGEKVLTAKDSALYDARLKNRQDGQPMYVTVKDTTAEDKRNTQDIVDALMLVIKANAAGQGELRKELHAAVAKLDRLQRSVDKVRS